MQSNQATIQAVRNALSAARVGTYEAATGVVDAANPAALELYAWNALVSGALLTPLHICEVVIRNSVADALEALYGNRWPWSSGFERCLPDPPIGYSPRKDLQSARRHALTTGKVIPEMKFVFWQKMFTGRYDTRLWNTHLVRVLPNLDQTMPIGRLRQEIYEDLEQIRKLRNRIAHHEPIFARNLADDFQRVVRLIEYKCKVTAGWMMDNQHASTIIGKKP